MIRVQGLEKRYGEVRALKDVYFEVERGEVVGLLGQNGAGKTTCMKVLTGYLEPTAGQVSIGGHDVIAARRDAQARIGYLPEHNPLYLEMTVTEYLSFMSDLRGLSRDERARAIPEAIKVTGLEDRRHQLIRTLSKGYRQRVGLAQAILHKPSILILDEPTNGLDPLQIQEIRALIKRLARDTTILLSTHILSEIEAVCDRVLILIEGELAADTTLADLLYQPELRVTVRGGAPDEVIKALRAVEGVSGAEVEIGGETSDEATPDHDEPVTYIVRFEVESSAGDTQDAQDVQRRARAIAPRLAHVIAEAGWSLSELAPHAQSLEGAFRALQAEYVSSRSEGRG